MATTQVPHTSACDVRRSWGSRIRIAADASHAPLAQLASVILLTLVCERRPHALWSGAKGGRPAESSPAHRLEMTLLMRQPAAKGQSGTPGVQGPP